ncbi:MAG: DUF2255 family protein [Salinimicrobium sediminis]|nr:DUF2255 family protein [Salinimicrobium sediminis]
MTNTNNFPNDFQDYLNRHTLIGIKAGVNRESFLNIWMVQVGDRFFSRSWNKSPNSWFTSFITSGVGQIKYGESIINVLGKKVLPDDPVHKSINMAYLQKYDQPENLVYSRGITQPEYADYTMEFLIDPNQY